jgi:hypothetical protein
MYLQTGDENGKRPRLETVKVSAIVVRGAERVKWIEVVLVDTEKGKKTLGPSLSSLLQSSTSHLTPESSRGTGTGTGTGIGAAGAVAILSWKCRY